MKRIDFIKIGLFSCVLSVFVSCTQPLATKQPVSLYQALGGQPTIETIVDHFIEEIGYNKTIFEYFKNTKIDRFREKMNEHLCKVTGGGCEYTGDSMELVHKGMNINESDFNLTVDLLINAMTKSGVSHRNQNKVLARLAPMRKDMIYR